jgi:putative hydrolase of HD superfamily
MPLVRSFYQLNQLKLLYRQGWLRRGIPPERCESVADHVFSMAMLGWWLCDERYLQLDRERVLRMALAHELGEIYAGDLTPADGISPAEKQRREREGLRQVVDQLASSAEILALWEEFEAGETPEARFVRQLDRLEMALQASVYQSEGADNMEEFFASARQGISDPALREILESFAA